MAKAKLIKTKSIKQSQIAENIYNLRLNEKELKLLTLVLGSVANSKTILDIYCALLDSEPMLSEFVTKNYTKFSTGTVYINKSEL